MKRRWGREKKETGNRSGREREREREKSQMHALAIARHTIPRISKISRIEKKEDSHVYVVSPRTTRAESSLSPDYRRE